MRLKYGADYIWPAGKTALWVKGGKPVNDVTRRSGIMSSEFTATSPEFSSTFIRGWEECRKALTAGDLGSDPHVAGVVKESGDNLLLLNGDLNHRLRHIVVPYMVQRARLDRVKAEITELASALSASLPSRPEVDLITDLAEPIALAGIISAMEIPVTRRSSVADLTRGMLGILESGRPLSVRRKAARCALRIALMFERDAASGTAVGLHAALEEAAQEGLISRKFSRSTSVIVLHGGYENPRSQLGSVISWAVEHAAEFREAALSNPAALLEEITRLSSPVRLVARWPQREGESREVPPQGAERVWIDLESANHDERYFPALVNLDSAKRPQHLSFGYGQHACPGRTLATIQGQVLIEALLKLPPDFLCEFSTEWHEGVVSRAPAKIARRRTAG